MGHTLLFTFGFYWPASSNRPWTLFSPSSFPCAKRTKSRNTGASLMRDFVECHRRKCGTALPTAFQDDD